MGWLNDMTVRNECALYNYRLPVLYRKWTGDIRDTQGKITGAISDTAPFLRKYCFRMVLYRKQEEFQEEFLPEGKFLHRKMNEGIWKFEL